MSIVHKAENNNTWKRYFRKKTKENYFFWRNGQAQFFSSINNSGIHRADDKDEEHNAKEKMAPPADFCFLNIHVEKHIAITGEKNEENGKIQESYGPFNNFENEKHRSNKSNAHNRKYLFSLFTENGNIKGSCELIFGRIFKESIIHHKKAKNKRNNSNVRDRG